MDKIKHIVNVIALIKNPKQDKFLIIKRSQREKVFPGQWALPGGKLERGETVSQTLQREVYEETGLKITGNQFIFDYSFTDPDGSHVVGLCFLAKASSENVKLEKKLDDYQWIKPKELKNFNHVKGMEKVVRLAFKT